jgi:hypothetical protein
MEIKNNKKERFNKAFLCLFFYFCLGMHIYDGYFDINQILASQNFSIKYFLFRMYYLGFFIAERISGIVYIFNFSGGKFGHLLKKCDCCEKKY